LHTVLFPGGRLPLRIFEQRYMEMAKACIKDESPFGVCLIREGSEVGEPAIPTDVGCLARISHWDMPQLGLLQVTARGERRFRIVERRVQPDGLARGRIELLPEEHDAPVPANMSALVKLLERADAQQPGLLGQPRRLDSCAWVSSRLAELLPLPLETKQALLELHDARERLERLSAALREAS
jgi:Lon protease-like protein